MEVDRYWCDTFLLSIFSYFTIITLDSKSRLTIHSYSALSYELHLPFIHRQLSVSLNSTSFVSDFLCFSVPVCIYINRPRFFYPVILCCFHSSMFCTFFILFLQSFWGNRNVNPGRVPVKERFCGLGIDSCWNTYLPKVFYCINSMSVVLELLYAYTSIEQLHCTGRSDHSVVLSLNNNL